MELSRITVCSVQEGAENLYHKGGREADGTLVLRSGEVADFRTYFSSLDAQFLLEKTTVRHLTLRLFFDGKATVRLCRAIPIDKRAKKNRKRYTEYVACEKQGSGEVRINTDVFGGGLLGITVTALEDTRVYGGVWECSGECVVRTPKLGLVRTENKGTFKQNEDTYTDLLSDTPVRIYVVDSTGTIAKEDVPDGITLINSRNLGGSGSVSRGMIECMNNGDSHFLLIKGSFDPNVIRRTVALLSVLSPKYEHCGIGGGLMSASYPCVVKDNGLYITNSKISHPKRNTPTDVGGLLWCRENCDVNFCGWWYYCAPTAALHETGLAMPFYNALDDAEFGLRLGKVCPMLYTIGMCVWYDEKDDEYLEYYSARNKAITRGAAGLKLSGLNNRINLISSYFKCIARRRDRLNYIYDGWDDYLKGPNFLIDNDGEVLNDTVRRAPRKNRGFFGATGKMISLYFRLFRSRKVNKLFREKMPELTSAESWAQRLKIGDDE